MLVGAGTAQALGPQRQFLAVEPHHEWTNFDATGASRCSRRIRRHRRDERGVRWSHGTALRRRVRPVLPAPSGGRDHRSFLSAGGGRHRLSAEGEHQTYWTFSPGGGIRIPIPNRFELRADAKGMTIFGTPSGVNGEKRTTNNLVLQAGIGLTF